MHSSRSGEDSAADRVSVRVYTLGCFRVEIAGAPLRSGSKPQRKPLELLKVLGGESVAAEQMAESLWPDAQSDHACSALTTSLSRLRKRIGHGSLRLQLFALAHNLGNFLRRLPQPRSISHCLLRTLQTKLIKIGAKVVRHARYTCFQMAEVLITRDLFAAILRRIRRLMQPVPV